MFPLSQLKPGQFQGGRAEQRERFLDLEMLVKVGADTQWEGPGWEGCLKGRGKAGEGAEERHPRSFAYNVILPGASRRSDFL